MSYSEPLTSMTVAVNSKQQLPANGHGTLDASTPYAAVVIAVPPGAKSMAVYLADCDDPRFTLSRTVINGDVLTSSSSAPFPTNQWFRIPLGLAGNTEADAVRPLQVVLAGNTVGAHFYVLAMPSDE